ncbi:MAG: tRNA lysidine(34) synthetase TilS [Aestuariivirgaceae bacterium]
MSPKKPAADRRNSGFPPERIDRILSPLKRFRHLALAVSGGADSVALMHLASRWRCGMKFTVLTLDHGLRANSRREAQQVVRWARSLGLDAHRLTWGEAKPERGLQSRAREARYRLFARWCAQNEAEGVVTAHTLDDQAETFLMRLARGSGVDGLSAMANETVIYGVRVLRPLLDIRRAQLRQFLEAEEQDFFDDPSNADPTFERVRIRQTREALSKAGVSFEHLAMAARRMGRAREALEQSTDRLQDRCVAFENEGHAIVDLGPFLAAAEEIRLRLLARLFARMGGSSHRPRLAEVERFGAWLSSGQGQARTLGGCRVKRRRDSFIIGREGGRMAKTPITIRPGETHLFDDRFKVRLHARKGESMTLLALGQAKSHSAVKRPKNLPEFVFRTLPALVAGEEIALVPHLGYSRGDLGGGTRAEVAPIAGPHNSLTIQ